MFEAITRENVTIASPRGRLSGELAYAAAKPAYVCVIFNPHPHMGGSADNPVVAAIANRVAESGGLSLRFDYAGVGRSEGPPTDLAASMAAFWDNGRAPEDPGMVHDAVAVLRWLQRIARADIPLVLAGYSFGAYVATACLDACMPAALAMISPTLAQHDFSRLQRDDSPRLLVVSGENDFATPATLTQSFVASLDHQATLHVVPAGEHFFRGAESSVAHTIAEFFKTARYPVERGVELAEVLPC